MNTYSQANLLSAVPARLRNHKLLQAKGQGACASFTGKVTMLVVFVDDPQSRWYRASISKAQADILGTASRIQGDAIRYGAQLYLQTRFMTANASISLNRENYQSWVDSALTSIGLPTDRMQTCTRLETRYSSDEVVLVFCTMREGRSFASLVSSPHPTYSEFTVIYGDTVELYHEVCHLFGAQDLYAPLDVYKVAEKHLPNSIMANSSKGVMENFTAYLIGWTDTLSKESLRFLEETAHLTESYLNKQESVNSYTGFVTNHQTAGGSYTGYLVDGIRHGRGKFISKEGHIQEGTFVHGVLQGQGTYKWPDGSCYTGSWSNGDREGQGTMRYRDGSTYTGHWHNDQRDGLGTARFPNGNYYEGSWKNNDQDGNGCFHWASGDKFVGNFARGKRHGFGIYYFPNGDRFAGNWENNVRNGQGVLYFANGKRTSGIWKNDKYIG